MGRRQRVSGPVEELTIANRITVGRDQSVGRSGCAAFSAVQSRTEEPMMLVEVSKLFSRPNRHPVHLDEPIALSYRRVGTSTVEIIDGSTGEHSRYNASLDRQQNAKVT